LALLIAKEKKPRTSQ